MNYTPEEVEGLIEASRDGEGLEEIESRLGPQWFEQQKRDGKSMKEIIDQVQNEISKE